nr:MAG TPA: hypothetical protein [Caudoviricetes sp.]
MNPVDFSIIAPILSRHSCDDYFWKGLICSFLLYHFIYSSAQHGRAALHATPYPSPHGGGASVWHAHARSRPRRCKSQEKYKPLSTYSFTILKESPYLSLSLSSYIT